MRALSWIALGSLALACGGSAFTTAGSGEGGDGGSDSSSGTGGKVGTSGSVGTGGKIGTGGKVGTGGISMGGIGIAGIGIAGDLVTGGTFPVAGEPGVAGTGPDPIDEVCPVEQPDGNRGCADGLSCSYGTDVRSACRTRAKCDGGKWLVSAVDCVELHACANIVQGNACDAAATPGCILEGYIYCACTGCSLGGPCSSETVWKCAAGSGGNACPKLAPNEGQTCTGNAACTYGSCVTDGPVTATCNGATWGWQSGICPN